MIPGQSATPGRRIVHCERHGDMQEAFVCEHLLNGIRRGFFTGSEDTSSRPDAWCSICEGIRREHGGWNSESEALISVKLVCGGCYDEIRARNVLGTEGSSHVQ
jgi:hypothetical protein